MGSLEDTQETDTAFSFRRRSEIDRLKRSFDSNSDDINEKYLNHIRKLMSNIYKDKSRYREELEELEQMGEGSFGKVFKCRSKIDNKLYAVKQVQLTELDAEDEMTRTLSCSKDKDLTHKAQGEGEEQASEEDSESSSPSKRKALLNGRKLMESFTMSQLDHPNVIRYHSSWIEKIKTSPKLDSISKLTISTPKSKHNLHIDKAADLSLTSGILYIQMELCECHTLKRWLYQRDKEGKIDPTQNIALFAQIVYGLHYIHKSGYFHRDIKPANIFLNPFISSPAFLVAHHHSRRKSNPTILPFSRARSPLGARSSRAVAAASSTTTPTIIPSTAPPLNRVTSLPTHSRRLHHRAEGPSTPLAPSRSPLSHSRPRADSFPEKGDEDLVVSTRRDSGDSQEGEKEKEKEKEIPFESTQAYSMANYIAKIGDFGLATKLTLGRNDPEDPSKDIFSKENSPISSPPLHASISGTNSKEDGFTPQVSPLPNPFGSESPPPKLPCAHHHGGHDGEEPRPCRRPGVRTCGIGTTLYAAPEQLYSHYYGTPVDVFSLGLILVELYSTAESRKDRYRILKRARKGLLPQGLAETFPQEAELISKMLQLNASERPTIAEILRHPLLQFYVPSPRLRRPAELKDMKDKTPISPERCSTPLYMPRSNSLLAIPSALSRTRSGRVASGPTTSSEGGLSSSPPEGQENGMVKSKRSTVQYRPFDPPLSSPYHLPNQHASFSFDKEETRKTTPVSGSLMQCTCNEEIEKLQTSVKEQKDAMDQMTVRMHTYEEQLSKKDLELQNLKKDLHQLQLLYEKMQHQFGGSK